MAYVALYRAYRPQKFSEVVGQEHIIKTLQNAIKLNKVAHAYLFCGPRGTGKTTLAKIMAKAMNCENGPTTEPCGECENCKAITKGTLSDVIEIDAASNNGADDIRALRETVKFLPAQGKYKVYIIDEVHMLSNAAFNALLKTLEEPPKHVIFILATTEPYKLPNTILSRCQRFDFQSITIEDILYRLKIVAKEENINISLEALQQIATSAEGGMRDALSLFDQCISYSVNEEISLDDVLAVSGNVNYVKIIDLLNACISEDEANALVLLNNIIKEGKEVPRIINDIELFLRDVLLFKNNTILEDRMMFKNEAFVNLSNALGKNVIYKWLDILNNASQEMRFSTQKRAFLELAILKMNDTKLNKEVSLLDKIESLEKTVELLYKEKNSTTSSFNINKNFTPNITTRDEIKNLRENKANFRENEPTNINKNIIQENKQNVSIEETPKPQQIVSEEKPASPTPNISDAINQNNEIENEIIPDDEINILEIEEIINNASKEKKEALVKVWSKIAEDNQNNFAIQMLVRGKIVAVSDTSFIVELMDLGFCNRVMAYENYVKVMEVFNECGIELKNYICIPSKVWEKIIKDYKSKYSLDNKKPKLENIRIGVKRTVIPNKVETVEDEIESKVKDLFSEDEIKIIEE